MMEILGTIRKFFGYPWQKEWPKPPYEAQLFIGGGLKSATLVLFTASILRHGFPVLFGGWFDSPEMAEEIGNLLFLLYLAVFGIPLVFKNKRWFLWVWSEGAVLQRGFERIELSGQQLGDIREVGNGRLHFQVHANNKRYKLPLDFASNLYGLRKLLGPIQPQKPLTGHQAFKSSPINQDNVRFGILCVCGIVLDIAKLELTLFNAEGSLNPSTVFRLAIIIVALGVIGWLMIRNPKVSVSLDLEGFNYRRIFRKRVRWTEVTAVRIKEGAIGSDVVLTIEAGSQNFGIPASIPNYWHLEQQILERVPSSVQVTRQ